MNFKQIDASFYNTICDKLTRLEPANIRYKKLFDAVLAKYYHGADIRSLSENDRAELAANIINSSIEPDIKDKYLEDIFSALENEYFVYNSDSYHYLSYRLNLYNLILSLDENLIFKKNVIWLRHIAFSDEKIYIENKKLNPKIKPINKIILCEGQTEYYLLNTLFDLFDVDIDKCGLYVIPAGGKNQVIKQFYKMSEYCKIPFFILMDNDAIELKPLITPKLRSEDVLYILKCGEFEDLIPSNVIKSTINYVFKNNYNCNINDFDKSTRMVKNIEYIYKKYGFGDFKKAHFAKCLNDYIKNNCTKEDFLDSEIMEIVRYFT